MTRPLARSSCHHCGFRIYRREGAWWHETTRDRNCVDRGAPTGDLAHPAGTTCPEGCADRLQIIDVAEGVRDE